MYTLYLRNPSPNYGVTDGCDRQALSELHPGVLAWVGILLGFSPEALSFSPSGKHGHAPIGPSGACNALLVTMQVRIVHGGGDSRGLSLISTTRFARGIRLDYVIDGRALS